MGDEKLWDRAEDMLKKILEKSGKEYYIEEGDGAFYGPKIDIVMKDALGRPWQMGTIQLDFQQPIRFDLKYTGDDGKEQTPIVIHRVIYGSLERFIGVLIEHTAGNFPIWLAPEQVRIITVNQEKMTVAKAQDIADFAKKLGVRTYTDNSNESVGKKIRASATEKIPYTIVIGEKEISDSIVSPRLRRDIAVIDAQSELHFEQFIQTVANESKSRVNKSSL
jgi:threonyl-tRNA synthetase